MGAKGGGRGEEEEEGAWVSKRGRAVRPPGGRSQPKEGPEREGGRERRITTSDGMDDGVQ